MKDKDTFFSNKNYIRCRGELIDLSSPKVMGILNITPDSFYNGGRYTTREAIFKRIEKLASEGADFIDIGGYSSRPGAKHIESEEEIRRLDLGLKIVKKKFPDILISVDTFRSEVAEFAVKEYGVDLINDISAGETDPKMFETIALWNIPYIMMHMKGTPQNMQKNPEYKDVMKELIMFFSGKVNSAKQDGIIDIIIDPGFGFGKTLNHNYTILNHLDDLKILGLPIMIGLSRKSMIYKLLQINPEEALNGTSILNTLALEKGANIIRVHDVKEARQAISLINATIKNHN